MILRMSPVPAPPGPVHDLQAAFPFLQQLGGAARAGDWGSVSSMLAALDDGDDLATAARTVADTEGAESMLEAAVAAAGDGAAGVLPRSLLAHHHIRTARRIRTGRSAAPAPASRSQASRERLRRAELLLIDAVAVDPAHTLGWHLRLSTARGLGLGQSEARRRYDRLAAHRPRHYPAQRQLLQQLCPKWGGSWEAAHAFAEECRTGAEPGGLGALIGVEAHVEHWMSLEGTEKHSYWWAEGVQESLTAAAEASVLHPRYHRELSWIAAHTVLAAAFSFAGRPELAAPHFTQLGGFTTAYPWNAVAPQADALWTYHRDAALAAGRKA
jgi:hypothetical protein